MRTERVAGEPLVPLLRRLGAEIGELVSEELALAQAEMRVKIGALVVGIALLVVAALLGVGILATLTACLILALALVVPAWLAALIVTVAYAIVAGILALVARGRLARALPPVPTQTLASIKENIAWAKTLVTSSRP